MISSSEVAVTPADDQPKHAKYSPSSLKSREICPGWIPNPLADLTRAKEGTLLHFATEKEDTSFLELPEQKDLVTKCLNFVTSLVKKLDVVEDVKEERLKILDGLTFGTADRIIVYRSGGKLHAIIIDYKFGMESVDDAETNRQGFAYALGVFEAWDVETVTVYLLMPRRDEVTSYRFTRQDIARMGLITTRIIARCQEYERTGDESMLNLTEVNCTRCGRLGTCPKALAWGQAHAKRYAPLEIVEEVHSSQITDPAKMAALYTAAKVLEKLVDSVKAHVISFAHVNELPGYTLSERSGRTEITNGVLAYPVLKQFFDDTEIASSAKYSYSDLQGMLSDKTAKGKKSEEVRRLFNALLDADAVKIGEGTMYLKRVREPVSVASESNAAQ